MKLKVQETIEEKVTKTHFPIRQNIKMQSLLTLVPQRYCAN